MKLSPKTTSAALSKTDCLIAFGVEGQKPELPKGVGLPAKALDEFDGKARKTRACDPTRGNPARVILVGLGKGKELDAEGLRRAAAVGLKAADAERAKGAAFHVGPKLAKLAGGSGAVGQAVAEGALMASYRYDLGKSKPEARPLKRISVHGDGADFKTGVQRGTVLAEANLFTRDLQNLAGNQLTPTLLAERARGLARDRRSISCKVLDEAAMKRLGMGLLLGVSQGSEEPAKLIHLVYKPKGEARGKVALVGKGLTFDAGGTSIKPSRGMEEMRYDMSGSAAVLGAFHALRDLDVPYEVHGIVPTSENLCDGKATKPGDVHVAMNGKTVEVINTDAEGRLILADALCYTVEKVAPDTIIDLATLTGAVIVALGHEMSGCYSTTDRLRDALVEAGQATGETVWPMPLHPAFDENLAAGPADLRNICTPNMGGGSIVGAHFLRNFVGKTEWSHLDIAGTAWNQGSRDYTGGSGGTGVGTRLLIEYLSR